MSFISVRDGNQATMQSACQLSGVKGVSRVFWGSSTFLSGDAHIGYAFQVCYEDGEEEQLWLAAERVRLLSHPGEHFCLAPSSPYLQGLAQKMRDGAKAESGKPFLA